MSKSKGICGYCGKFSNNLEKEHVIPRCLYPPSKKGSKVQRITIPACKECNNGWADDEAHFRNVLSLCGDPNDARRELWEEKILPSFKYRDGIRRTDDLINLMKPIEVEKEERFMIFPAEDDRVIRIVKKIIRGLSYYHKNHVIPSDKMVWCDIQRYEIPENLKKSMLTNQIEDDIIRYQYEFYTDKDIWSSWVITFYENITFYGFVSPDIGFFDK